MKIILASASPRRRELLGQIGISFEIRVSNQEEQTTAREPEQVVEELARQKAEAVMDTLKEESEAVLVIGADTVVAVDGQILGKPAEEKQAVEMLKRLSGRSHQVYTGVALLFRPGRETEGGVRRKVFHEATRVEFYPLTEAEVSDYVACGESMDKAGAYGIQGIFARYVKAIEGDYTNVVGLPVGRLYQELKEWGEWERKR